MATKKAVLQLSIHGERTRTKAFVTVSRFPGVTSITMDDKTGKMTVVGEVDVPIIVMKLRKICNAEIVSVGAVKPPEKTLEPIKSAESIAYPTPMNYPYQYNAAYAISYYHPYTDSIVVVDEPNTCVIM